MEQQQCKKCKSKQEVINKEFYKTEKGKNMMRCECKNCHSKIIRFAAGKKVVDEPQKEIVLKELKVV